MQKIQEQENQEMEVPVKPELKFLEKELAHWSAQERQLVEQIQILIDKELKP